MRLKRKAQMSLIMILVVALALVFYAVSVNWSRISAYKTQVTLASNTGAATLVSMMASYGEYWLQSQLGGDLVKKEATGTLVDIIVAAVLIIIAVVVAVATWGAGTPLSAAIGATAAGSLAVSAIVGAGLAVLAVAVDVAWVQPGLTKAWSRSLKNIPTIEGQFAEQGIQSMLTGVVTDKEEIEDLWDMDMDGRWYPLDPDADKISRFGYYYTQRLSNFLPPIPAIEALKLVLLDMEIYLGLPQVRTTERSCELNPGTLLPQCDPCCQIPEARPETCDKTVTWLSQCAVPLATPGCTPSGLNSCFVYDLLYPKTGDVDATTPYKLMSALGGDDPDPHYWMNGANYSPEWGMFNPVYIDHDYSDGFQMSADGGVFRGTDSTGIFFPLLWLMADTSPYVKDLWVSGVVPPDAPACLWRARDATGVPACQFEVPAVAPATLGQVFYRPVPPGAAYSQLTLPTACTDGDCYVNMFKNTIDPAPINYDARRIDGVSAILPFLPVADNVCSPDGSGRFWKKGADRFGQTFDIAGSTPPVYDPNDPNSTYYSPSEPEFLPVVAPIKSMDGDSFTQVYSCSDGSSDCQCTYGGINPERWRDDLVDIDSKALINFSHSALAIMVRPPEEYHAMMTFVNTWGPELVQKANALNTVDANLQSWITGIDTWLAGTAPYDNVGADLWCLPEESDPALSEDEHDYILQEEDPATGEATTWGSLHSVIRCLEYNRNNYQKFADCYNDPEDDCTDLPRSLAVDDQGGTFDPNAAAEPYYALAVEWPDAFLTRIGYARASLENIPEENLATTEAALTAARDAVPVTADFYLNSAITPAVAVNVDLYFDSLSLASRDIWTRIEDSLDATIYPPVPAPTPDEYLAFNTELFPLVYEVEAVEQERFVTPSGDETPYMTYIRNSRDLARNQSAKFDKRRTYLSNLRGRAIEVRDSFQRAHDYLSTPMTAQNILTATSFLPQFARTPVKMVEDIVEAIQNQANATTSPLGNDVIYGWFSNPTPGMDRSYGYLHLVKVQASIPAFRGSLGNTFPVTSEGSQVKPWVDTDTNWIGTKRIYELKDYIGFVGARVIRFDEDHGSFLRFLSGTPLWQIMYRNPRRAGSSSAALVESVYQNCRQHYKKMNVSGTVSYVPDVYANNDPILRNGFLFDLPIVNDMMRTCAESVNRLLEWGIGSETCAMYFPTCEDGDEDCAFDIKFVSCKE